MKGNTPLKKLCYRCQIRSATTSFTPVHLKDTATKWAFCRECYQEFSFPPL